MAARRFYRCRIDSHLRLSLFISFLVFLFLPLRLLCLYSSPHRGFGEHWCIISRRLRWILAFLSGEIDHWSARLV